MANLKTVNVIPATNGEDSWYKMQKNFYTFNTQSRTPLYIDMKTNLTYNQSGIWMIEAVGYNYGTSAVVRSAWSFSISSGIESLSLNDMASGITAKTAYISSDNYVVLKVNATDMYFLGFVLNAYTFFPDWSKSIQITAAAQSATSGRYY